MTSTLYEVLNKKGKAIARVDAEVAARMADEIGGSTRAYVVEGANEERFMARVVQATRPAPPAVPAPAPARTPNRQPQRVPRQEMTPWGTQTTRVERIRPDSRKPDRQKELLRDLLAERAGNVLAETIRADLNKAREAGTLNRAVISDAIRQLIAIPRRGGRPQDDNLPEVPAGRYAIERENSLSFYKVDRPTEGRWAGRTFVRQIAGPNEYPVRGGAARPILRQIAQDPEAAARRYGQEIGSCGRCGRRLTNDESRAYGIGPECREKGW